MGSCLTKGSGLTTGILANKGVMDPKRGLGFERGLVIAVSIRGDLWGWAPGIKQYVCILENMTYHFLRNPYKLPVILSTG